MKAVRQVPAVTAVARTGALLQQLAIFGVFILLLIAADILAPGFLAPTHMGEVLGQASILGLATLGETLVLIIGNGGIDLSVGSVITVTSIVVSAEAQGQVAHLPWALAVVLVLGAGIGLVNGLGVVYARIPPLIMTLAVSSIIDGAYLMATNGFASGSTPAVFNNVWTGSVGTLFTGSTLIWLGLALALGLALGYTRYGRLLYFVGGNRAAARASGVAVPRVVMTTYVLTALMATASGLALTGYIGVPSVTTGADYTLTSIAAAVIGGATFEGGVGTVLGAVGGALVMTVLAAILTDLNMAEAGRQILEGVVLVAVVLVYQRRTGRLGRWFARPRAAAAKEGSNVANG